MARVTSSWLLNTLGIKRDYCTKPPGFQWRSSQWFIVFTVSVALWTDFFLYGLVVPILPFLLQDRLKLPKHQIQTYVSGLLAAFAASSLIFSPVIGYLADRISTRQTPFLFGLLALLGSTTLLLLGTTLPILFIARILQGLSGAFVWTIGLVLCVETVGTDNLGKTMGSIFGSVAVGNLLSPPLGGFAYDRTGHKGVFVIAFAILSLDFVLRILVIEPQVSDRYMAETRSSTDGLATEASQHNGNSEQGLPNADETTRLLTDSAQRSNNYEYRITPNLPKICHKIPILPCLADRRLLSALFLAFVQAALLGSFDATIPTIAQEYYNLSPLKASLLFLPLGATNLALGPVFGSSVDRFGTKLVAVIGYVYLSIVLCLLRLPHPRTSNQVLLYGGILALCGIGMACIGSPPIVEAARIVEKYYESNKDFYGNKKPYAQLYGLNNIVFSAGLALGPEFAGDLKQRIGYGNMNLVLASLCVIAALLSWRYIGETGLVCRGSGKRRDIPS